METIRIGDKHSGSATLPPMHSRPRLAALFLPFIYCTFDFCLHKGLEITAKIFISLPEGQRRWHSQLFSKIAILTQILAKVNQGVFGKCIYGNRLCSLSVCVQWNTKNAKSWDGESYFLFPQVWWQHRLVWRFDFYCTFPPNSIIWKRSYIEYCFVLWSFLLTITNSKLTLYRGLPLLLPNLIVWSMK